MPEDQSVTTVLKEKEEDIRRGSDFHSIYSNHTTFNVSAFDFGFTFGEIINAEDGHLYIDQKVRIMMSPLHTKIFAAIIANNVKNYEAQFGEIMIPHQNAPSTPTASASTEEKDEK